ncbi:MAG: hypothetical protein R3249_05230 [Nitriliruptorales bacterium]|nr:hypothetical protein [Nitriliruptorales bacterium]
MNAVERRPRWPLVVAVVSTATLPYVTVFANNVGEELDEANILAWWATTLIGSLVVLAGVLRLPHRWRRWATVVWIVLLFQLFNLPGVIALRDAIGWNASELVAWFAITGAVLGLVSALARFAGFQAFVFLVAPLLLLSPSIQWISGLLEGDGSAPNVTTPPPDDSDFVTRPSIWYVVLDGMASLDFVREHTGHDGSAFAETLTDLGFTVSPDAESNYPITILSVGSNLDLEYVYDGLEEPRGASYFARLQGENKTVDALLDGGWSYAHTFPGLWRGSRCSGREDFCYGGKGPLNDTEVVLADLTPLGFLLDQDPDAEIADLNDPAHVVRQILAADLPSPTYNFVHLLNPHPPYLRAADCSLREADMRLAAWGDGPEYGDAYACLEQQLLRAVDQILAEDPDPLIILQGDHGPRFGVVRGLPGGVTYAEDMFFSIFSAIRLPAACDHLEVPADIDTVNTFRLVFACLRGQPFDRLEHIRYPIHRT